MRIYSHLGSVENLNSRKSCYNHILTSQQERNSGFSYATESWADVIILETIDDLNGSSISEWTKYNKPVINAEDRYSRRRWADNMPYFFRRLLWSAILSGGSATWGESDSKYSTNAEYEANADPICNRFGGKRDYKYIQKFLSDNNIKFWEMQPYDSIVSTGKALVKMGQEYIIYLPNPDNGGVYTLKKPACAATDHNSINENTSFIPSVTVDLSGYGKLVLAKWYDPRTGTYSKNEILDGGSTYTFTAPGTKDWVLYIKEVDGLPLTSNPIAFFKYLLHKYFLFSPF